MYHWTTSPSKKKKEKLNVYLSPDRRPNSGLLPAHSSGASPLNEPLVSQGSGGTIRNNGIQRHPPSPQRPPSPPPSQEMKKGGARGGCFFLGVGGGGGGRRAKLHTRPQARPRGPAGHSASACTHTNARRTVQGRRPVETSEATPKLRLLFPGPPTLRDVTVASST